MRARAAPIDEISPAKTSFPDCSVTGRHKLARDVAGDSTFWTSDGASPAGMQRALVRRHAFNARRAETEICHPSCGDLVLRRLRQLVARDGRGDRRSRRHGLRFGARLLCWMQRRWLLQRRLSGDRLPDHRRFRLRQLVGSRWVLRRGRFLGRRRRRERSRLRFGPRRDIGARRQRNRRRRMPTGDARHLRRLQRRRLLRFGSLSLHPLPVARRGIGRSDDGGGRCGRRGFDRVRNLRSQPGLRAPRMRWRLAPVHARRCRGGRVPRGMDLLAVLLERKGLRPRLQSSAVHSACSLLRRHPLELHVEPDLRVPQCGEPLQWNGVRNRLGARRLVPRWLA